ncbi:hypothetical protein Tco_0949047 [Tanacetum coccineum]
MVSYNRILSKDWFNPKPVIRSSLQWHQSQRFKPWEKPIRNRLEDYEMRYSLKNGTTDIVPKSSQRKKLSHEGKTTLKEKLKEIEAFNSCRYIAPVLISAYMYLHHDHLMCRRLVMHAKKTPQGKKKAQDALFVKNEVMFFGSATTRRTRIGVKHGNLRLIKDSSTPKGAYKNHMSPTKSLFKRLKDNFKMLDKEEDERKFIFSYGVGEASVETKDGALLEKQGYFSFERHLDELHVTWDHLEKKRTRLRTNTKTLEDLCSQSLETASQAIQDAVTTHQVTAS